MMKDLFNSYEKNIEYIPIMSSKLEGMQTQAIEKAEVLQGRMKELITGYEKLDEVSSAVSAGFLKAAEDYREKVLDVALGGGIHSIGIDGDNLDRLKAELDSIAHERVVIDVLTRDLLLENKKKPEVRQSLHDRAAARASKVKLPEEPIIIPAYPSKTCSKNNATVAERAVVHQSRSTLMGGAATVTRGNASQEPSSRNSHSLKRYTKKLLLFLYLLYYEL